MISEKLLVGKVMFRVPWVEYLVLFASSYSGLLIAAILITAVIIVKLVVPKVRGKKTETKSERNIETTSET